MLGTRTILSGLLLMISTVCAVALDRQALSADAQALVPEEKNVTLYLNNGERLQGNLVTETADRLVLKIRVSDTISTSRTVVRSDVKSIEKSDVAPFLAAKLLEITLAPNASKSAEDYQRSIALFDEFLEKCKDAEQVEAIQALRDAFAEEAAKVSRSMERVGQVWFPPVAASIARFDAKSGMMELLQKRDDFQKNERAAAAYRSLVDERREIARLLPEIMRNRLEVLLQENNFHDAVYETTRFLQFWILQVVNTEGPAREVLGKMDFSFIIRMMERVMNAYRETGIGNRTPSDAPRANDMIYVPGGYFMMADKGDDPRKDTFPMRLVYVSPFLIDKYEVTNAEYRKFVAHAKDTAESWFEHPDAPPLKKHDARGWAILTLSRDQQPVVGVDWFDAFAYARWVSGRQSFERGEAMRLPTEAEWEKAARGLEGLRYPWGEDAPDHCEANWPGFRKQLAAEMDRQNPPHNPEPPARFGCSGCAKKEPLPPPPPTVIPEETWAVDQFLPDCALAAKADGVFDPPWKGKDISPYGVFHMAGNAAEWVQDYYDPGYFRTSPIKDPQGPEKRTGSNVHQVHVYRGGGYLSPSDELTAFWRGSARDASEESGCRFVDRRAATFGAPFIGFRCVKGFYLEAPANTYEELMDQLMEQDKKYR